MHKPTFALALCAAATVLVFISPAWAIQWTMIGGTDQRWWIDTDSISLDQKQGITFFTEAMSDSAAVPPDSERVLIGIGTIYEAIDCATGEQFTYGYDDDDEGRWTKEMSKWPPEYHASVRRIVCKQ